MLFELRRVLILGLEFILPPRRRILSSGMYSRIAPMLGLKLLPPSSRRDPRRKQLL